MSQWERYQKARKRKRFQGTVIFRTQEPESHKAGICERRGCHAKVTHAIYALGYIAGVCQEHYEKATNAERDNAVQFKYAER
jgi:hypothetical protein